MIHYLLFDAAGAIAQRGICGSESDIPSLPGMRHQIVAADDPRQPDWGATYTYSDYRRAEYPSVGEQMDMLWHAMNGGVLPKVEPFFSRIADVKNKYPKQANNS